MATPDSKPLPLPPDRHFGLFAAAVLLLGAWLAHRGARVPLAQACVALALIVAGLAAWRPSLLAPANRAWARLGWALGRVVNPLVLGAIFLLVVTPFALVMRLAGRDALRLRERRADTYWIERQPPGPAAASFKNPF